jgi:hypothetical protein
MSGPYHCGRERCLPRSRFSPPGARRQAGAAAHGLAGPGRTPPPALLTTASPIGPAGPAAPVAASRGPRRWSRARLPRPAQWCPGRAPRLARRRRCRCGRAAAGVPGPGRAVAAADGRRGGRRAHAWRGSAVPAGSGHPVRVVRRSRWPAGLAAPHGPAQPGRVASPAASGLARADLAAGPAAGLRLICGRSRGWHGRTRGGRRQARRRCSGRPDGAWAGAAAAVAPSGPVVIPRRRAPPGSRPRSPAGAARGRG